MVLANYAEVTTLNDGKPRDKPVSLMIGYLAERIEPAETVFESALYADYNGWCRASGRAAVSASEFVRGSIGSAENGLAKIRKRKGSYCGMRLAGSHETLATG